MKQQNFILEIGDMFTASPLATHRGEFLVMDRYEQAGFCYYVCLSKTLSFNGNEITFRNKDVDETTIKKQIKKEYLFSYVAGTLRRFEIRSGSDMESVFEAAKIETKNKYGFANPRAFFICSDQDSEEIRDSWNKSIQVSSTRI